MAYELGDGLALRLTVTEETAEADDADALEALEKALAVAAGWPTLEDVVSP